MTEGENIEKARRILYDLYMDGKITTTERKTLLRAYFNSRMPYGEWKQVGDDYECTNCGHIADSCISSLGYHYKMLTDFCPNCGAYMVDEH